jgi:hypothetical protein
MADEKTKSKTVKLAFVNPMYNSYDFKVSGVDEIRAGGTEVPAGKEKEVREAARKKGIELTKV